MGESQDVTPVFVDADALAAFLDSLRAAGYRIGTEKYIAAHDVALALAARPRESRTAERLCSMLRPLLCSTQKEQQEFTDRFRVWADRIVPRPRQEVTPLPSPPPPSPEPAPRLEVPLSDSLAAMKRLSASFWALVGILGTIVAYLVWAGMRPPVLATVHVQSSPAGAIVRAVAAAHDTLLEGSAGDSLGVTGLQWSNVAPGRYTLHFHLPGHLDRSHDVTVSGDSVHHVDVTLARTPRGSVVFTSDPPGATIRLEPAPRDHASELIDTIRTATTPVEWSDLSAGSYRLAMALDGYDDFVVEIGVQSGQLLPLDVVLQRTRMGRIAVDSEPDSADIIVNGTRVGVTPAVIEQRVGTSFVTLRRSRHRDSTISVVVRENEPTDTSVELTALRTGLLEISTDPPGARLIIDQVQQEADARLVELLEGSHSVRAELPGYEPRETPAFVVPDSTTALRIPLTLLQPLRYRVAFHPESAMIATGDPGVAVVTWNDMTTRRDALDAASLRIRRGGYRDSGLPWSVLGLNRFSDPDSFRSNLNDVVAVSPDGRWTAVTSSGPFRDLFTDGLSGDSLVEVRIFDHTPQNKPLVEGIVAGGGVLAMRFNRTSDSLHVVTRNALIVTMAWTPCAFDETCAANFWHQTSRVGISNRLDLVPRRLDAASFENDSIIVSIDEDGTLGRYDRSIELAFNTDSTGIGDPRSLFAAYGRTIVLTNSDSAHIRDAYSTVPGAVAAFGGITAAAWNAEAGFAWVGTDSGAVGYTSGLEPMTELLPRRHRETVTHVAVSADGRAVVSASRDGTLALWDTRRSAWVASVWLNRLGVTSLDSALLGRQRWQERAVLASWSDFISTDADRIQFSDYADEVVPTGGGFPGQIGRSTGGSDYGGLAPRAVTFSPDGDAVVVVTSDGMVRRWNVGLADRPDWLQGLIQNVAFSPDSTEVVVPGAAGTVEVWDTWLREKRETLSGHAAHVTGVAYNPDQTYIATGDAAGEVRLWARTPLVHHWLSAFAPRQPAAAQPVTSFAMAFSPDGSRLASRGDDNELIVWNVQDGTVEQTLPFGVGSVTALAFSPSGRRLIAGDSSGNVLLANIPLGGWAQADQLASPVRAMSWLNDSTFLAVTDRGMRAFRYAAGTVVNDSGSALELIVADSMLTGTGWEGLRGQVIFSGDGLAITMRPSTIDSLGTRFEALRTSTRATGALHTFTQYELLAPRPVTSVAISHDGNWVAAADEDLRIHVVDRSRSSFSLLPALEVDPYPWSVDTDRLTLEKPVTSALSPYDRYHEGVIQALAFSPDARILASAAADSTIAFWDLRRGERIGSAQYTGSSIRSLAFHPSGRMLASFGEDGTIRVWDLGIGIPLRAQTREITSLSFSRDGRRLASASADSTIVVWDLWGNIPYDTIHASHAVESVAFSPDGRQLLAATADSAVLLWDASGSRVATVREWLGNAMAFVMLILLGILAFATHRWLWWRRASRILVRRQAENRPEIQHFALRNVSSYIFPQASMIELARRLRRRIEFRSDHLDIPETVTRTVRRGVFTAAFSNRLERPEYVALVDRTSMGDQQTAFVDDLIDRLVADDVPIERYYFDGDMRMCFPRSRRERPVPLTTVAQKNAGRRLLIFSDSSALFDPVTGDVVAWVDQLRAWSDRALFTPEPRETWTGREARLSADFTIRRATHTGLLSWTERGTDSVDDSGLPGRYPRMLRRRPRRWVERDQPESADVARMIDALRDYLGEAGFLWLCACAVYPEMNWRLTINLGVLLEDDHGAPLIRAERLAALARLPWFRHDYMPDWLRTRLLDEMPEQREQQVRRTIEKLLVAAVVGNDDPHDLEIARGHERTFRSLARSVMAVMRHNARSGDAARDYVFQAFMSGRRTERLAVRLPRALIALLDRRQREALPTRLAADARRLQWAALAGVPALAVLAFGGTAAWQSVPEAMVRLGTPDRFEIAKRANADSILAAQRPAVAAGSDTMPAADTVLADTFPTRAPDPNVATPSGPIDIASFLQSYRDAFGPLDAASTAGLGQLLQFINNDPDMGDLRYRAFVLATVKEVTSDRFVPIVEVGDSAYFERYEPGTPTGKRLGNTSPGDGIRYRGRGYILIAGRENYAIMSKKLGYDPMIGDLVERPESANDPVIAYRIMSSGIRDGVFTGRKLAEFINDERTDYGGAALTVGSGSDRARIAEYARTFENILQQRSVQNATASLSIGDREPIGRIRRITEARAPGRSVSIRAASGDIRIRRDSIWLDGSTVGDTILAGDEIRVNRAFVLEIESSLRTVVFRATITCDEAGAADGTEFGTRCDGYASVRVMIDVNSGDITLQLETGFLILDVTYGRVNVEAAGRRLVVVG